MPRFKNRSISNIFLVHGSVKTLIAVHTTLIQMFRELTGDAMECLRSCLMTRTQTTVLVATGTVHGVLLHFRVPFHYILQVPLHLIVLGVEVNVLYLGAGVDRVAGVVHRFVLRHVHDPLLEGKIITQLVILLYRLHTSPYST